MSEMTVDQIKSKRRLYLLLSALAMFFLGLIYAFSMFVAPMCSTFGLEKTDVALTFNIAMIVTACGTMFGALLDVKFGLRFALFATGVLSCIGFIGTAILGYQNLMAVYVLYGGIAGLAAGMGNNLVVATTNLWFPEKVGFSSGVMMMCFSFSALGLGNVALMLIPAFGLSAVFSAIGIGTLLVVSILAFVLRKPPANIVELMAPQSTEAQGAQNHNADMPLKTPIFYLYWCWAIIIFGIGMATIGNCASDAQIIGIDLSIATLLVGFVSLGNGLARFLIGLVYDKTNIKVTMALDGIIALLATSLIVVSFFTGNHLAFIIGALCCGFCYGGVPVAASAFARKRFGSKNYAINLSLANFAMVFGSLLNVIITGVVGATNRDILFVALMVLAVLAILIMIPFSKVWNRDMGLTESKLNQKQSAVLSQ